MQVAVIGGGSWGTTVAHLLRQERAHHAVGPARRRRGRGARPPPQLARTSRASTSPRRSTPRRRSRRRCGAADVLVMGVPSHGMRETAKELAPYLRPWVPVVSLSKGLEQGTRLRMTQVLEAELPGHPCGVLTGPNLAKEILAGDAAASVIAMDDPVIAEALQDVFASDGVPRVHEPRRHRLRGGRRAQERHGHRVRAWPTASAPATTPAPRSSPAASPSSRGSAARWAASRSPSPGWPAWAT